MAVINTRTIRLKALLGLALLTAYGHGGAILAQTRTIDAPTRVEVRQREYGELGGMVVSWERQADYDRIQPFVDDRAVESAIDGALSITRVDATQGEHTFGVQGLVGEVSSEVANSTPFNVVAVSPVDDPVRSLVCEYAPDDGGMLRFSWENGDSAWELGEIEFPGLRDVVEFNAIVDGERITSVTVPAPANDPEVALLRFLNDDKYYSEPVVVSCPRLGPFFRRGDCNISGRVDITDAVTTLNALFLRAQRWKCDDACDANDDGRINITDPIYALQYLFLEGDPPPFPGPENCGFDRSDDFLAGDCVCE